MATALSFANEDHYAFNFNKIVYPLDPIAHSNLVVPRGTTLDEFLETLLVTSPRLFLSLFPVEVGSPSGTLNKIEFVEHEAHSVPYCNSEV